ncbi:10790_t:CDS:1, partial [Scutellospora calospora]
CSSKAQKLSQRASEKMPSHKFFERILPHPKKLLYKRTQHESENLIIDLETLNDGKYPPEVTVGLIVQYYGYSDDYRKDVKQATFYGYFHIHTG